VAVKILRLRAQNDNKGSYTARGIKQNILYVRDEMGMSDTAIERRRERSARLTWRKSIKKYYLIYVMILPAFVSVLVFSYFPMPGIIVAFQDFNIFKGFFGSPWAKDFGLYHFKQVFAIGGPFFKAITNTLYLNILGLAIGFPVPIILALLLNELQIPWFKRITQSISYLPYFLSSIIVIGLVMNIYDTYGPINELRILFSGPETERANYLMRQDLFVPTQLFIGVWQGAGWGSILYLAAIAGVDQSLYEAAAIDGAGHFKRVIHITLPTILPTATMVLLFSVGGIVASGSFDYVYGLQNPFIEFEVISTIVFKRGIGQGQYSVTTALGLMQGVIAFLITFVVNRISKALSDISIF